MADLKLEQPLFAAAGVAMKSPLPTFKDQRCQPT
jgi:hypothetical protein